MEQMERPHSSKSSKRREKKGPDPTISAAAAAAPPPPLTPPSRRTETAPAEEELQEGPTGVMELAGGSVTVGDLKKLKEAGLHTIEAVAFSPKKFLTAVRGISEAKADELKERAVKRVPEMAGFRTAASVLKERKDLVTLTTGSRDFDKLLGGGGIETGSITEVFGEARTGKTQIAHQLAVTAQLPVDVGGGDGKVLYFDTSNTFRPERLIAIAERYNLDRGAVLDNVKYARVYSSDHFWQLLIQAGDMLLQERHSLIVVDTLTGLLRSEYSGRGELFDRQARLGKIVAKFKLLADEFGVAVLLTNEVTAVLDSSGPYQGEKKQAYGGHVRAHAVSTRIQLRKGAGAGGFAKLVKSASCEEREVAIQIAKDGIRDAELL